MGIWINIISSDELKNLSDYVVKEHRFQLDKNEAIFCHLETMFNQHVELTDTIIAGGDEIIKEEEMQILISLIEEEMEKLKKIYLDQWEFQLRPKVNKTINGLPVKTDAFDPTKAYLAEQSIFNARYEIRKGKLDKLELRVEKQWYSITKKEILDYLNELKSLLCKALENKCCLYFTSW